MTPINIDRIVANAAENRAAGLKNMTIDCDDARALCNAASAGMELERSITGDEGGWPLLEALRSALMPFGRE